MTLDRSVLAVYCYSREVADVLVGTRKLVEKGGLATVLIAYEGKSQKRSVLQRLSGALRMETSAFAEARMLSLSLSVFLDRLQRFAVFLRG